MTAPVLSHLLAANARWAEGVKREDPTFFKESSQHQAPKVLWIGCADSRVPESVIMACKPGEIFVHRNIANQFHLHDDSAQSVLAYAVEHLHVEHSHTNCGGVQASYDMAQHLPGPRGSDAERASQTPLERWLTPLAELVASSGLASKPPAVALPIITKKNIEEQISKVVQTAAGKRVPVHGWLYHLETGLLEDLHMSLGPK